MGTIFNRQDLEAGKSKGTMEPKDRDQSMSTDARTQIEQEEDTDYQPINWKRFFFAPKNLVLWIVLILIVIATVIITIKHDQVVAALRPFSEKVRDLPAGWLIPIAILFIISFPPLFGHEIVALLCGVVYGLWIGFGIVSAGTFFGEIGTWFAFQYLLRSKAQKLERTNLNFAALARLTREGGFWIVLVIRFSAIPSHFSTAVFATCGVNFWSFTIATFLTLPKQLFLVYLGVLLLQEHTDNSAKNIIFGIAFVITIIMAFYIYYKLRGYKDGLLKEQEERRLRRQNRLNKPNEETQPLTLPSQSNNYPLEPISTNSSGYKPYVVNEEYSSGYGHNDSPYQPYNPYKPEDGQHLLPNQPRNPYGI